MLLGAVEWLEVEEGLREVVIPLTLFPADELEDALPLVEEAEVWVDEEAEDTGAGSLCSL